jgi:hypothetical protein
MLRSVHVGSVMYKVALGQVIFRVLRFSCVSIIPPVVPYSLMYYLGDGKWAH